MSKADNAKISVYLTEEQVNKRIAEIGAELTERFKGESVYLVCILRGSVFFTTELAKRIDLPVEIDFMMVSSYGAETRSSGVINIKKDLEGSIEGKNVIVVEDIIDSGLTLKYLNELFSSRKPASITTVTCLKKQGITGQAWTEDICGFEVPNEFVVGYGLDYAGYYRNLPYIGVLREECYR